MLDDETRREIEAERDRYDKPRAACIDALRIVQRHHRWVSGAAIEEIAALLDMPASEVERVAAFYDLIFQRPVGRHIVLLCDSVSCHVMGCQRLESVLRDRLGIDFGQTTADGRFTLLPVACLGHCQHAPAVMIDEDVHGHVDPEAIDALLEAYA